MNEQNGHQDHAEGQDPAPVRYGDRPNNYLLHHQAEGLLRELFETRPELFGTCLAASMTGVRKGTPGRKAEAGK